MLHRVPLASKSTPRAHGGAFLLAHKQVARSHPRLFACRMLGVTWAVW
jgi:hypothetical protein